MTNFSAYWQKNVDIGKNRNYNIVTVNVNGNDINQEA